MDPRAHSEPLRMLAACPVWEGLDDGTLVVACSGGRDSVSLARAAHELLSQGSFRERFTKPPVLLLWHLDHGLRDASPQDATFVAALGDQLGVPTLIEQVNLRERLTHEGGNLEAVARDVRYSRLLRLARGQELPDQFALPLRAMTAHHLGDQAETILHHILRGTHLSGLGGIAAESGGYLFRPWLELAPELLDGYLAQLGQAHCEDSTNYDLDRTRNRLRHEVMPLLREINPRAREHIAHLSKAAVATGSWLVQELARLPVERFSLMTLLGCLPLAGWPGGSFEAHFLRGEYSWKRWIPVKKHWGNDEILALHCFAYLMEHHRNLYETEHNAIAAWAEAPEQPIRIGKFTLAVPHEHVLLIEEEADMPPAPTEPLGLLPHREQALSGMSVLFREARPEEWQAHHRRDKQGHEAIRDFGALLAELCAEQPVELSWHCYLPESVSLPLTLRTWREGERITLAGGGSKTLGDVFTDAKVPHSLRRAWAVMADSEDRAVWLPGLAQGALMQIPVGAEPQWHLILRSGGG